MTDPKILVMDVSHSFEVDASVALLSLKGAMGDNFSVNIFLKLLCMLQMTH